MSRDSRIEKRNTKLKKLAAKHGLSTMPLFSKKTDNMLRKVSYARNNQMAVIEYNRALKVVFPDGEPKQKIEGVSVEEQRAAYEAKLLQLATEAKILINGKRDIVALQADFIENLARIEHQKRMALR